MPLLLPRRRLRCSPMGHRSVLRAPGVNGPYLWISFSPVPGRRFWRRGRSWCSPVGEVIYVSVILRPRVPPSEAPQLVLLAAVAAAEALLVHTALPVSVKWPNDILVGRKKVAGILTEMRLAGDRIDHVVIGMGVNVNTPAEGLPPEIAAMIRKMMAKDPAQRYQNCAEVVAELGANDQQKDAVFTLEIAGHKLTGVSVFTGGFILRYVVVYAGQVAKIVTT